MRQSTRRCSHSCGALRSARVQCVNLMRPTAQLPPLAFPGKRKAERIRADPGSRPQIICTDVIPDRRSAACAPRLRPGTQRRITRDPTAYCLLPAATSLTQLPNAVCRFRIFFPINQFPRFAFPRTHILAYSSHLASVSGGQSRERLDLGVGAACAISTYKGVTCPSFFA